VAGRHFDAIIIGSGFGGAVTAYRLAEAGLSVCVLERGKPYPPGSFPRTPHEMGTNFWEPSKNLYGLFDIRSFRSRLWAVLASGLGGGSLIFASTLHRKDEKWFVQEDVTQGGYEHWPVTRADLDPHYDRVERMLGAQRYPFQSGEPFCTTPKTRELKWAAEQLGLEWDLPKLAVTFANDGSQPEIGAPIAGRDNLHCSRRFTCRLCGECNLGCNFGSKNSLDFNYLTGARRFGAEIRTLAEARELGPLTGGGYFVRYLEHEPSGSPSGNHRAAEPDGPVGRLVELACDRLILSAGTFGTTELLLRNRCRLPEISSRLGLHFSINGNLLAFACNAQRRVNDTVEPRRLEPSFGPVITSAIRVPDLLDGGAGRGFYIEDAGYPIFLEWILEVARPGMMARLAGFAGRRWWSHFFTTPPSSMSSAIATTLGPGRLSSSTLPLLGMGRDIPGGVISLRKGHLDVDWRVDASREYFTRLSEAARSIAEVWEAEFRSSPFWHRNRMITAHPLGGCSMGRNPGEGVVDAWGEVFGCPGLYVADGSVMPGPVGANPALTIAALADRFADGIIEAARSHSAA